MGTIKDCDAMSTKKDEKIKFYSLKKIDATNAQYRIIIGERSNGKTYAILLRILENYILNQKQGVYVRRWMEDVKGYRADTLFENIVKNGWVDKITKGKYNTIIHYRRRWYLALFKGGEKVDQDPVPMMFAMSLTEQEHDKSTSYPDVTTIFFDELLTRQVYLPDEFVTFMNVISTIVRLRTDVTVYMAGNTVNKHCPYFKEMGINHIDKLKQGTIDVYRYGDSGLSVAIEYCNAMSKNSKPSSVYFAFRNEKLHMITSGLWELSMYPHAPCKILPKDIIANFFIEFDEHILHCEIVRKVIDRETLEFIYIHEKTTEIKDRGKDIIFSTVADARPNVISNITRPVYDFHRKILKMFIKDKVFYQSNDVGELVRNYFNVCSQMKIVKESY